MKFFKSFSIFFVLVSSLFLAAPDVSSQNVVGYVNLPLVAGDNLIANMLHNTNNTLNGILAQTTPEGSTCTLWNAASAQFFPISSYTSANGWSINYELLVGAGALFRSNSPFTNTFVGEVPFDGSPIYTFPSLSPGTHLISCSVPQVADFNLVMGRNPYDGESVRRLDPVSQNYFTTTFHNGAWDNSVPSLRVGESAFFTVVPEPAIGPLLACGVFLFGMGRMALRKK